MVTIENLEKEYDRIARLFFSGENRKFPLGVRPTGDGTNHIEISDDGKLSLVATDRSVETIRKETYCIDEFMYWIFVRYAKSEGYHFELKNRDTSKDFRRIAFFQALEAIGRVSSEWRNRLKAEQSEILKVSPYIDKVI